MNWMPKDSFEWIMTTIAIIAIIAYVGTGILIAIDITTGA